MSCTSAKKENCLRLLLSRYNNLGSGIINYISEKHDFDVVRANTEIVELTGKLKFTTQHSRVSRIENADSYLSIDEIEDCIDTIQSGVRVLVFLRGLPGSGKSSLAKSILKACFPNPNYKDHIHSADNFFMHNGKYIHVGQQISEAHSWNQANVRYRMEEGYSPLFVDNTNLKMWEMTSYLGMAVIHSYKVIVLELNTKWCLNCNELTKKNQHNVPKDTILNMMQRYEMGITAEKLLKNNKCPLDQQTKPLLRRCPPLNLEAVSQSHKGKNENSTLPRSKKKEGFTPVDKSLSTWNTETSANIKTWQVLGYPQIEEDTLTKEEKPSTADVGTNTALLDFHGNSKGDKILYGKSREITDFRKPPATNKPGMLSQGCWTQNEAIPDRNEDLKKLIDIFQNVPPAYIRDMYDDCKGNFDMTFEIFLEDDKDYSNFEFGIENVVANTEDIVANTEDIVANTEDIVANTEDIVANTEEVVENSAPLSDSEESSNETDDLETEEVAPSVELNEGPSTSTGAIKKSFSYLASKDEAKYYSSDDENSLPSSELSSGSQNDIIEMNLGEVLVKQLEEEFGDPSLNCPKGFQPFVQIPRSMARQLYAMYVESMYVQMDNQQTVLDAMVKEDEAFALKLQRQEISKMNEKEKDSTSKKTPQNPIENFRDIMNEQVAMKIHMKQMPELKTPNDLATLLTKKKLFESFPTVNQDIIMELYHANGLNYRQTVEDLSNSIGRAFGGDVMEPPISPGTLAEMEIAQNSSKPIKVDEDEEKESTAEDLRAEADWYLKKRNELYQKAQNHFNKGQREVAQFYSQLAQKQTHLYEVANSKAACVFLQQNATQLKSWDTLDLHYLYVKEAIVALDMFIDTKIAEMNARGGKFTQDFLIITGRGKRSVNGISKILPAVCKRLQSRKIRYHKVNPGLLKIKLRKDTPVTNDL